MNHIRRICRIVWLPIVLVQSAMPADAARIYNMTNRAVIVTDSDADPGRLARLKAGDATESRSPSLNWTGARDTIVRLDAEADSPMLCRVEMTARLQIDRGNYFLIAQDNNKVTCTLCDSDQRVLAQAVGVMPAASRAYRSPQQSCR